MVALAEAFVRVRADTKDVRSDVRDEFGRAGRDAGDEFSRGFTRDARGRLRDERGRFVSEGRKLGEGAGDGFNDGFGGALGGLGNIAGRALGALTPRLSSLASGFGLASSAAGGLTASVARLAMSAGVFSAMAAGAASATSSILGLAAALAPAAGALAALPAAVLLNQAAMATLKVALMGVGDAFNAALGDDPKKFAEALEKLSPAARTVAQELRALKPAFDELRSAVQDSFFAPLQGQLTAVTAVLSGPLRDGMTAVAGEFGRLGSSVAAFAQSASAVGLVRDVFATLESQLSSLESGTVQRLLTAMSEFARSTLPAFEGLGASVDGLANRLAAFLERATASGDSLRWIQGAVTVFKQLGGILRDLGGIVSAVFRAMESAGGGVLGVLGQLLDGMHAFLDSAKGQEILVTVFRALGDIGRAFLPVIESLAGAVALLAPHIADLAQTIGPILSTAINAVAPALEALGPALVTVFTEFGKAVQTIADSGALKDMATAIGDILVALAPLLPSLADILVPLLQGLATLVRDVVAPALETVVGWIQKAVEWIKSGGGLTDDHPLSRFGALLRDTIMPIVSQAGELIGKVFTDIVAWVQANQGKFEEWGARIGSIIQTAGQIISQIFEGISIAWDTFGGPLLDAVGGVFDGILQVVDGVMTAIKGLLDVILGAISGDWDRVWNGIKDVFGGVWEAIKGIFSLAWNNLKAAISTGLALVGETWNSAWTKIKNFFSEIWNSIVSWVKARVADVGNAIDWFAQLPGKVSGWFGQVKDAIVNKFNEAVEWVRSIPQRILAALGNAGAMLYDAGRNIVQGLINGISSMISNAVDTVTSLLNELRNRLPFSPAKEGPFSGKGWTLYSGQSMVRDLAKGIVGQEGAARTAMQDVLKGLAELPMPALAATIAPELGGAAMRVPSMTPSYEAAFAGASASLAGEQGVRPIHIENLALDVHVQGVIDPSDPMSMRRIGEQLRDVIRDIERERFP